MLKPPAPALDCSCSTHQESRNDKFQDAALSDEEEAVPWISTSSSSKYARSRELGLPGDFVTTQVAPPDWSPADLTQLGDFLQQEFLQGAWRPNLFDTFL